MTQTSDDQQVCYLLLGPLPLCSPHIHLTLNEVRPSTFPSLVPRPRLALRRFQYGKAGRAWYLFSLAELTGCISRIVQLTTRLMLGV